MRGVVIMKLQRTFILTLVCLFILGLGIVSATEPEKIYPSPVRDVMATTGEIIAVDGDKVTVKGDGNYPVATVIVTDKTLLIDGKDGDLKGDRALKKGRKVTAYYPSINKQTKVKINVRCNFMITTPLIGSYFLYYSKPL